MSAYRTVIPAPSSQAPAPGAPGERFQPVRTPGLRADAGVPLAQSVLGGYLIATSAIGALALVAYLAGMDLRAHAGELFAFWLLAGVILTTLLYFSNLDHVRRTIWATERLTRTDLSRDGVAGPPPDAHPFPVGAYQPTPEQIEDDWHTAAAWFIRRCYATGKCGEKAHIGQRKPNGDRLTAHEYEDLRDTLIRARYAYWKDERHPGRGWVFRPGPTPDQIIAGLQRYRPPA